MTKYNLISKILKAYKGYAITKTAGKGGMSIAVSGANEETQWEERFIFPIGSQEVNVVSAHCGLGSGCFWVQTEEVARITEYLV